MEPSTTTPTTTTTTSEDLFPILDITCITQKYFSCETWRSEDFMNDPDVKRLVHELSVGFRTWGFLYIKGHGIPQQLIDNSFKDSKEFFLKPNDTKMKCKRGPGISLGYLPPQGEIFDETRPNDLKECFDFLPSSAVNEPLGECVEGLVPELSQLFEFTSDLMLKVLRLLAIALDLDMEKFVNLHRNVGDRSQNGTSMRMLYYPCVDATPSPQQQRCGEHTDYGTLTLLYQDNVGGLEVLSPSGQFIKAKPIPGTIVINAADLLHKWSDGKFLATLHRVTIPSTAEGRMKGRQSIAFFAHPDYDVTIENSDDPAANTNAYTHLAKRFNETIVVN